MIRFAACLVPLALIGACDEDVPSTDAGESGTPGEDAGGPGFVERPDPEQAWMSHGAGFDNARHNADEYQVGPENVGQLVPRWRIEVDRGVTATPVAHDGVVYFADWGGTLHAVDYWDGSERWSVRYDDGGASAPRGTLALGEDALFVADVDELIRFDLEGQEQWRTPVNDHPLTLIDSSPVVVDDTVILGIGGYEIVTSGPYSFRGAIAGFDATTGQERWRHYVTEDDDTAGAGVSVWSSAAVDTARKLLFIGTGNTYEMPASPQSDSVVALNYETGEYAWHHQFTEGDVYTTVTMGPGPDHDIGASPNLFQVGDRDVVGVGDKGGTYRVMDRDTGEEVWATPLNDGSPLGGVMTTAALDGEHLYVSANDWVAFGYYLNDHSELDTSTTYALDPQTGDIIWQRELPAPAFGALTVANGVVYQPTITGLIHGLDASSGEVLWTAQLDRDAAAGIPVVDGTVLVGEGFEFGRAAPNPGGALTAYGLVGSDQVVDATGEQASYTEAECKEGSLEGQASDCRDCLCECDATPAAQCENVCWEVATECAFEMCGEGDADACVREQCNRKLLPTVQLEALIGVTACHANCASACQ